ncbi:MAG: hypothetical protein AUJ85_04810 [Elusimicrobia bacterium CG1_02_37_114]|nr:MAG: hypothetical protein AUJ85_04810 [Elusimicrobia bacterium CG1_02_37_114]
MFKNILKELRNHAPFTAFGAITGIVVMLVFKNIPSQTAYHIFYILHPAHIFLSALVTAAMYKLHTCEHIGTKCITGKCNLWILLLIGYTGSVGIATLSDSIIPFVGESLLNLPNKGIHIGFIEKWWLINPLAVIGIVIAYFKPTTKFPHSMHVLVSTWASLFHIIMASGLSLNWLTYIVIFFFLFIAVWIPCCVSDIVFPLLFVQNSKDR